MKAKQGVNLYFNSKSEEFLIVRQTIEKEFGWTVGSGDFIRLDKFTMHQDGIGIVLASLKKFGTGKPGCELDKMTSSQRSKFHRDHIPVAIYLDSPHVMILQGMEKVRGGGGVGKPEDRVTLDLPCSNIDFLKALDKVLKTFS